MNSQDLTYIQLDDGEDIVSIRDRLSFLRGQRVLLIWPEDGTALTRKLDLVFVQREARRRVIQLAFVTHDTQVINYADELGISTFETIKAARTARWKRGRTRVFIQRHHKPANTPQPQDLMPIASRVRKPRKRLPFYLRFLIRLGVVTALLAAVLATLYITVPSASITIAMNQELIQIETTIIADPQALDVDLENHIIPAPEYRHTVSTVQQIEITENNNVVTLDDQQRLEANARQYLQGIAYNDIESQLTADQQIIIESVNIPPELLRTDWITFSHDIGERTTLLTLDMKATVEALVIDRRFAQQIIFAEISANIPPNMLLNPDSFLYRPGPFISIDDQDRITLQAFGEGLARAQLNLSRLQSDLTGRSRQEAQQLIAATVDIAPNSDPQINIYPNWLSTMPLIPIRIDINVEGS